MTTRKGDAAVPTALTEAAERVALLGGEHAVASEQARRLHPAVVDAIRAAGFARHFVPPEHGGTGGGTLDLVRALDVVGRQCAAAAWSASIVAGVGRMAGFLPAAGQARIWEHGPDTLVAGSLAPIGRAVESADGWRLSGTWPSISVADHCDWALVRAVVGGSAKHARVFAVPRADLLVKDTWTSIGMCGTGSNTVVIDDVLVPHELSFPGDDLFNGRPDADQAYHRIPLQAVNGLLFAAPALGAARGAYAHWSGYAGEKIRNLPAKPTGPGPSRTFYATTLARCAGEIDSAGLLLERAAATAGQAAGPSPLEVARNARDSALAAELLVTAVNRMFSAAGTSGQSTTSPLQRFWRDVNSAVTHVGLQFEPAALGYAGPATEQ
ncbi:acyl-CoA dehydrogenase family protein [Streptomyces sp. NPDC001852]|uniref:acyl-CoA dehydrogenase family protein n=1 Tax=Streptomyces sp. NPDC001852 TaxID=3364619 RepID=UPI0036A0F67C